MYLVLRTVMINWAQSHSVANQYGWTHLGICRAMCMVIYHFMDICALDILSLLLFGFALTRFIGNNYYMFKLSINISLLYFYCVPCHQRENRKGIKIVHFWQQKQRKYCTKKCILAHNLVLAFLSRFRLFCLIWHFARQIIHSRSKTER